MILEKSRVSHSLTSLVKGFFTSPGAIGVSVFAPASITTPCVDTRIARRCLSNSERASKRDESPSSFHTHRQWIRATIRVSCRSLTGPNNDATTCIFRSIMNVVGGAETPYELAIFPEVSMTEL